MSYGIAKPPYTTLKIGDKARLSANGIKYFNHKCPYLLPEWGNAICTVREGYGTGGMAVWASDKSGWCDPEHFELALEFEYDYV